MRIAKIAIAAASLACAASSSQAIPVQWEVQNFFLTDGGEVTGTYVYDAQTDVFSNVMLSVSAGSVLRAASFSFSGNFAADSSRHLYCVPDRLDRYPLPLL